jgi:hypothetical protein
MTARISPGPLSFVAGRGADWHRAEPNLWGSAKFVVSVQLENFDAGRSSGDRAPTPQPLLQPASFAAPGTTAACTPLS